MARGGWGEVWKMGKLLVENNINARWWANDKTASEVGLSQARERAKREKNNGGRLSTSRLCLSDHKIVHWYSTAPHQQQTFQLSLKRNNSIQRLSNNSFWLHLNHHYWQLKFANNSGLHMDPIDQIKVNSQNGPDRRLFTSHEQRPHNRDHGEAGISDWTLANSGEGRRG